MPNLEEIKKTEMDLSNLGQLLKSKMQLVEFETAQIKSLKREVRIIMIENDMKEFENPDLPLYIKCSRSFSFDIGMFKLEQKEIAPNFIKEEIITKTKDILDKKALEKYLPEIYKKYLLENTPRLTVK